MKQVKWGIIGLGNIAQKFSKSFVGIDNSKLLAVASKDKKKLKKYQEQFSIEIKNCFNNYDDLVNCKDLDIIYIALPNSLHLEWTIKCIKNKKNVLVEKPAALTFMEATEIKKQLKEQKVLFAEAFQYRYLPQTQKLVNLIKKDAIGDLLSINSSFGSNLLSKKNIFGFNKKKKIKKENRLFNKKLGGGAILDLGCYPVSLSVLMATLLKADFKKIKINNKIVNKDGFDVDVDSYLEIDFDNKLKAFVSASFKNNIGKKTEIIGKKGKIIIEDSWHGEPSILTLDGDIKEKINVKLEHNAYSYQIDSLSNAIINKKTESDFPGMTIEDTLHNMKILDMWRS